jgi:hypothetical protein
MVAPRANEAFEPKRPLLLVVVVVRPAAGSGAGDEVARFDQVGDAGVLLGRSPATTGCQAWRGGQPAGVGAVEQTAAPAGSHRRR